MKKWLAAVVVALTLVGCAAESPEQRAERIVQECRAVMAKVMVEMRRADPRVSASDEQDLVIKCIMERGTGDSR